MNQFFDEYFSSMEGTLPFANQTVNNLSRVWTLIFIIDSIIALSYTVFPKGGRNAS